MSEPKSKIFWSQEEKRMLATEMDLISHLEPGTSNITALGRAMAKLPPERRRDIKFWATVKAQLEPQLEEAKRIRTRAVAEVQSDKEIEARRADERVEQWAAQTVELVVPFLCKLLDHPDIRQKLRELAQEGQSQATEALEPSAPRVVRPFRLRVVVAGLLPAQSEEIKKRFASEADLRFWRSDESKDHLRALVRNCDVSIGMTDFLSHAADQIMSASSKKYVRHTGGISRLKDTVLSAIAHVPAVVGDGSEQNGK